MSSSPSDRYKNADTAPISTRGKGKEASTWKHLLHIDLALLEELGEPLAVPQLGRLLQAEQEEREVGAVLQGVSQLRHAHQLGDDGPGRELGQVGLDQRNVQLDLGALVQDAEESLNMRERSISTHR